MLPPWHCSPQKSELSQMSLPASPPPRLPKPFSSTSFILTGLVPWLKLAVMQDLAQKQDRIMLTSLSSSFSWVRWLMCYPRFYLAPKHSHLLIWTFLPISGPPHEDRLLLWPSSIHQVSESLSSVTWQSAAQASPSLALSAVERVRLNLKLILHPLRPGMDVKNELITAEASAIETTPTFPPNREWLRQHLFGLLSNWPLRFPSCICRQASTANWLGEGKWFTACRACSGRNVTCNAVCQPSPASYTGSVSLL